MRIPEGRSGFPTVSATMLRTYGAGGFYLNQQEQPKGCPRQFKAKYVERRVPEQNSAPLRYGRFIHEALQLMEEGLTPEEALDRAFPADMDPSFWDEARKDIEDYLARGASPIDKYATLASELDMDALLYEDEEFGPIYYRAILDWVGLDPDWPALVHAVDYKTNRTAPSDNDVKGDIQLKGQAFVLAENARDRFGITNPVIVMHLDAIKFREVEIRYSPGTMDAWHSWAVAVIRKILRDEEAEPIANPDCHLCPVKDDCPAWLDLPERASALAGLLTELDGDVEKLRWRDAADKIAKTLAKGVKEFDETLHARVRSGETVTIGDTEWSLETSWANVVDLVSLHRVLGDRFYTAISTSKARLHDLLSGDEDLSLRDAAMNCISRAPSGTTVSRRKVENP